MQEVRRLNLGAGCDQADGYIRVDLAGTPDVVCDARALPFADGCFGEVKAHHILEHIRREDLIGMMNECHRVLTPGGVLDVEVPLFPSDDAIADPTHVSFFVSGTFNYFADGHGHDEHRRLYGILPWEMRRRERLGYNSILGVTLRKVEEPYVPWCEDPNRCSLCGRPHEECPSLSVCYMRQLAKVEKRPP